METLRNALLVGAAAIVGCQGTPALFAAAADASPAVELTAVAPDRVRHSARSRSPRARR